MQQLEEIIASPKITTRIIAGYATLTDAVSIGGLEQPAVWADHVVAEDGDSLLILMVDHPDAPSQAVVIGRPGRYTSPVVVDPPWEGTVATAPVGSETITISTTTGSVTATFVSSYTPTVGDRVGLQWQGKNVRVLGKVGVTPTPPPDPPKPTPVPKPKKVVAPPAKKASGEESFVAADSGTYSTGTGSWNSYYGKNVYQGSYGQSGANRGAWFYQGRPGKLAGKKITRVRIWIPPRLRVGSYNSSVALNVNLHTSKRKPAGDVARYGALETITIPKNFTGDWFDLPAAWGDNIVLGHGISISGGDYAGVMGIGSNGRANSGQLRLAWTD